MSKAYWIRRAARQGAHLRNSLELNNGTWLISVETTHPVWRRLVPLVVSIEATFDGAARSALSKLGQAMDQAQRDAIREALAR